MIIHNIEFAQAINAIKILEWKNTNWNRIEAQILLNIKSIYKWFWLSFIGEQS